MTNDFKLVRSDISEKAPSFTDSAARFFSILNHHQPSKKRSLFGSEKHHDNPALSRALDCREVTFPYTGCLVTIINADAADDMAAAKPVLKASLATTTHRRRSCCLLGEAQI